jgi:hypothetical protein
VINRIRLTQNADFPLPSSGTVSACPDRFLPGCAVWRGWRAAPIVPPEDALPAGGKRYVRFIGAEGLEQSLADGEVGQVTETTGCDADTASCVATVQTIFGSRTEQFAAADLDEVGEPVDIFMLAGRDAKAEDHGRFETALAKCFLITPDPDRSHDEHDGYGNGTGTDGYGNGTGTDGYGYAGPAPTPVISGLRFYGRKATFGVFFEEDDDEGPNYEGSFCVKKSDSYAYAVSDSYAYVECERWLHLPSHAATIQYRFVGGHC